MSRCSPHQNTSGTSVPTGLPGTISDIVGLSGAHARVNRRQVLICILQECTRIARGGTVPVSRPSRDGLLYDPREGREIPARMGRCACESFGFESQSCLFLSVSRRKAAHYAVCHVPHRMWFVDTSLPSSSTSVFGELGLEASSITGFFPAFRLLQSFAQGPQGWSGRLQCS